MVEMEKMVQLSKDVTDYTEIIIKTLNIFGGMNLLVYIYIYIFRLNERYDLIKWDG